jgi:hypothetical protein
MFLISVYYDAIENNIGALGSIGEVALHGSRKR